MAAKFAGDVDVALKHISIFGEFVSKQHPFYLDELAEAFLMKGDMELAVETYFKMGDGIAS